MLSIILSIAASLLVADTDGSASSEGAIIPSNTIGLTITGINSGAITDTLANSTVVADKGMVVSRKDIIELHPDDGIGTSFGRLPSLSLVDYGSPSGVKSVSLRGLGSASTSIYIDGLKATNAQNGQPDLGFIDLGSFSSMTIDYAQNSVSLTTAAPTFGPGRKASAFARFSGGSFGTFCPSAGAAFDLGGNWSAKASASWFRTKGNYEYADGLFRTNNDIARTRAGLDLFKGMDSGRLHIKAVLHDSERGTPGASNYPDLTSRQKDRNGFAQANLDRRFSDLYRLNLAAKVSADNQVYSYSTSDYTYSLREVQLGSSHIFRLTDWLRASAAAAYSFNSLSSTVRLIPQNPESGDWNADMQETGAVIGSAIGSGPSTGIGTRSGSGYDGLEDSGDQVQDAGSARRSSFQGAATASIHWRKLEADLALLYNAWLDGGPAAKEAIRKRRDCLSPSISFRIEASESLHIVGFARRAFRTPTFNELYYPGSGNTGLNPEDAVLTDIGIEYSRSIGAWKVSAKADAFHYSLKDKIVFSPDPSDPTGFIWLPYNIGKVRDNGADLSVLAKKETGKLRTSLAAKYSLQDAVDRTSGSASFGQRVPYISKHSFSADASFRLSDFHLSVCWASRGERMDSYGVQEGWNAMDVRFGKTFGLGSYGKRTRNGGPSGSSDGGATVAGLGNGGTVGADPGIGWSARAGDRGRSIDLFVIVSNLLDERYEIIRYYPVPGRSITVGISIDL